MTKNSLIKIAVFSSLFLTASFLVVHLTLASSCPTNTTVSGTSATLVGEVTDDGGDPNLTVWLQYGKTTSYGYKTSDQSKYGIGIFCSSVTGLKACTTYHYRAVAKNSAGTSYGEDKSFTTECADVTVDIKANSSNGPVYVDYGDSVALSWTSENADSCTASGDWSGTKSTSGSQTIDEDDLDTVDTYTFTITCRDASGSSTDSDSVDVTVSAQPPTVITKPAVVTS